MKFSTPTPRPTLPEGFRNLRIDLSFEGEGFMGYQIQPHGKTVQGVLTQAWKILTGEDVTLVACSRLDAGVNAFHFVLNVQTASPLPVERILRGLNGILLTELGERISIYSVSEVPGEFHARFDAVGKHYRYLLWHGYGQHSYYARQAWVLRSENQPTQLENILKKFEGTHDFAAFRSQDCAAKTTTRNIAKIDVWTHPRFQELQIIDVWGEGFLKNMIRNIVGTAVDIAIGKFDIGIVEVAFEHGDRERTGRCAPALGLRLMKVYYSENDYQQDATRGQRYELS